jgi:Cupin domain
MQQSAVNYVERARENENFRETLATGEFSQIVLMTLQPGEEIGEEVHTGDQILLFVEGEGEAVIEGETSPVQANDLAFVPTARDTTSSTRSRAAPHRDGLRPAGAPGRSGAPDEGRRRRRGAPLARGLVGSIRLGWPQE